MKTPETIEEVQFQSLDKLASIVKQGWALLSLIVLLSAGAAAYLTRIDMRLGNVETKMEILTSGQMKELEVRVRRVEDSVLAHHGQSRNDVADKDK